MKKLLPILLGALSFALAQDPSAVPATPPQDKAHVEGTLVNDSTGQPVKKGTLTLQPRGGGSSVNQAAYSAVSDAEGKFVFDQVEPGRYGLIVDRAGYARTPYHSASGNVITVSAGQRVKDIRYAITQLGVIAGRVLDEDGDPIQQANVRAFRWMFLNGSRRLSPTGGAQVDDQGNFRLSNLQPARYLVSVDVYRFSTPIAGKAEEGYVPTFYPNAQDYSEATPVNVSAGAEVTGIQIHLRKTTVFRVAGKVVDTVSGGVVDQYPLAIVPRTSGPGVDVSRRIAVSRDGTFEFRNVVPGSYVIQPAPNVMVGGRNANDPAQKQLFGSTTVTVSDSNVTDVVMQLGGGAKLTGSIATENAAGQVQSGAAQPLPSGASPSGPGTRGSAMTPTIRLSSAESSGLPYTIRPEADGTFELHDVAPDRYRVTVTGTPAGSYVKSIKFGDQDITYDVLDVSSGSAGTLRIVISPRAADLSGVVHNDKSEPAADVTISIGPASPDLAKQPSLYRITRSDASGHYSLKNLAPGEYQVLAWDNADFNTIADPEFRAQFSSYGTVVKLDENSHVTSDVKLIPQQAVDIETAKLR